MKNRKIIQKGSEILRTKCTKVTDFSNTHDIINDLVGTMEYVKTTYNFDNAQPK